MTFSASKRTKNRAAQLCFFRLRFLHYGVVGALHRYQSSHSVSGMGFLPTTYYYLLSSGESDRLIFPYFSFFIFDYLLSTTTRAAGTGQDIFCWETLTLLLACLLLFDCVALLALRCVALLVLRGFSRTYARYYLRLALHTLTHTRLLGIGLLHYTTHY